MDTADVLFRIFHFVPEVEERRRRGRCALRQRLGRPRTKTHASSARPPSFYGAENRPINVSIT